mgnify:CR=1 FL=1
MSVIDTLITDRAAPGPYDWRDFNRVAEAVEYVVNRLSEIGYRADVLTKTDWTRQGIQSRAQMERYIANIKAVRAALQLQNSLPDSIRCLTYEGANEIERILSDAEDEINRMLRSVDLGWAIGIAHIGLYGGI